MSVFPPQVVPGGRGAGSRGETPSHSLARVSLCLTVSVFPPQVVPGGRGAGSRGEPPSHSLARVGSRAAMGFAIAFLRRAWRSGEDTDICSDLLKVNCGPVSDALNVRQALSYIFAVLETDGPSNELAECETGTRRDRAEFKMR